MSKSFIYKYLSKFLKIFYNLLNPILNKIRDSINKALLYDSKSTKNKTKIDENQIVYHRILRVVSDGVSEQLPLFCTRYFHEVSLLEKMLGELYVKKSLEIGCGYGRLTPWIAKHSKDHYSVEPTKELYEWSKLLYPKHKIEFTSCDDLPFPDNYFDLIVTWTVLQHIPPGRFKKSIEEVKRVLKNGGILVITEHTDKNTAYGTTWAHTIEEYSDLFHQKKLVEHFERKVEDYTPFHVGKPNHKGEVMKFI